MSRNHIALIIAGTLISAVLGGVGGFFVRGSIPEPEPEYYRGIYDVCMAMTKQPSESCLLVIQSARENKWYVTQSAGWRWP